MIVVSLWYRENLASSFSLPRKAMFDTTMVHKILIPFCQSFIVRKFKILNSDLILSGLKILNIDTSIVVYVSILHCVGTYTYFRFSSYMRVNQVLKKKLFVSGKMNSRFSKIQPTFMLGPHLHGFAPYSW